MFRCSSFGNSSPFIQTKMLVLVTMLFSPVTWTACHTHLFAGFSFCGLTGASFFSSNISLELLHYFSCSWLSVRKIKIALNFLIWIPEGKKKKTHCFLFGPQYISLWTNYFPSISIIYYPASQVSLKEAINWSSLWFHWPDSKSY